MADDTAVRDASSSTNNDNVAPEPAVAETPTQSSSTDITKDTSDVKSHQQSTTKPSSSNNNDNNNSEKGTTNSKQRKAARWKQLNKKKKEQKRKRLGLVGPSDDGDTSECKISKRSKPNLHWKKEFDEHKIVEPHEGSFANLNMQKLFNVSVDLPIIRNDDYDGDNEKLLEVKKESEKGNVDEKKIDNKLEEENGELTDKVVGSTDSNDAAVASTTDATTDTSSTTPTAETTEDNTPKLPKRKLAMLVSFLGSNYSGFQINDSKRTLQAELELGLYKAGVISQRNFGHPSKYSWSNSARTDKGVHAAAQVCSLKGEMIYHTTTTAAATTTTTPNKDNEEVVITKQNLDDIRIKVNECLPSDIRVLDFERVTRMFCARTNRDKVRYQYMIPSYMLCSQEEVRKAFSGVDDGYDITQDLTERITPMLASNIVQEKIDMKVLEHARSALVNHRATPEQMERLKHGLKLFEGTHCFHNYTRRVGANNASSNRYILSFVPLDPIIVPGSPNNKDGSKQPDTQWIPLQIVGQSFLLNQIRKMVSAAVDYARGTVSQTKIEQSLSKEYRIKVNVAPAQGLFLDRSYYDLYNKHKANNSPDRVTLEWVEKEGDEEMPPAGKILYNVITSRVASYVQSYILIPTFSFSSNHFDYFSTED